MNDHLVEKLRKALLHAGATHSFGDVMCAMQRGTAQGWGTSEAALVTEVISYPQRRVGRIWLAAGSLAEVIDLAEGPVSDFAREEGCDAAEILGREGWARILEPRGWRKVAVLLRKELQA
jgi:hypothetical protein